MQYLTIIWDHTKNIILVLEERYTHVGFQICTEIQAVHMTVYVTVH